MLVVKNLPANAGDVRAVDSTAGSGRFSGGGPGNPLQDYRLGDPMDRGAWHVIVYRISELDTTEAT